MVSPSYPHCTSCINRFHGSCHPFIHSLLFLIRSYTVDCIALSNFDPCMSSLAVFMFLHACNQSTINSIPVF